MRTAGELMKEYEGLLTDLGECHFQIFRRQQKADAILIQLRRLQNEREIQVKNEHLENHFPEKAP